MQPVIVLVIALVVAAAAGYGGYYYRGTQIPTRSGFTAGAAGAGARGGAAGGFAGRGGANGGRVNGQVISATATSMTVKLADGSSKIVIISGQTSINKAAQATAADLKSGMTVAVFGAANADGSVTAQSIQLNPMMASPSASPVAK